MAPPLGGTGPAYRTALSYGDDAGPFGNPQLYARRIFRQTLESRIVWTEYLFSRRCQQEVATLSDPKGKWQGSAVLLQRLMEIARASALAEMASGVAHELNQPLGAIATYAQAGERMLNRPEPMVDRALDVFRQISQEALGAGEGIKRIRRLFEPRSPDRTLCQMPEVIEELRPVLEGLVLRANGMVSVHAPQPLPDLLIDRTRIQHVSACLDRQCRRCEQLPFRKSFNPDRGVRRPVFRRNQYPRYAAAAFLRNCNLSSSNPSLPPNPRVPALAWPPAGPSSNRMMER